jgi:hypothetical protein
MTDEELKAMLGQMEQRWQQQSDDMLKGYVEQYQQMAADAVKSMHAMVEQAQQANAQATKKPEEIHMKWIEVNDKKALLFSEKAGNDVLKVFDLLAKLIPELQKRVK